MLFHPLFPCIQYIIANYLRTTPFRIHQMIRSMHDFKRNFHSFEPIMSGFKLILFTIKKLYGTDWFLTFVP